MTVGYYRSEPDPRDVGKALGVAALKIERGQDDPATCLYKAVALFQPSAYCQQVYEAALAYVRLELGMEPYEGSEEFDPLTGWFGNHADNPGFVAGVFRSARSSYCSDELDESPVRKVLWALGEQVMQ